jgi:hypothetical protein
MKAALSSVLALVALMLMVLAAPGVASAAANCGTAGSGTSHKPKPSSFAPRAPSRNHAYGAPIQKPILKSHPKHKPQLTSSPLPPESQQAPASPASQGAPSQAAPSQAAPSQAAPRS